VVQAFVNTFWDLETGDGKELLGCPDELRAWLCRRELLDADARVGSADLRRAFDQVWTLEKNGYGRDGACVGLDVKAMRTTVREESMYHLAHSRTMFLRLLDIVRGVDEARVEEFRQNRQYEQLEMLILNALTGRN